jgi:hypothetical protein
VSSNIRLLEHHNYVYADVFYLDGGGGRSLL